MLFFVSLLSVAHLASAQQLSTKSKKAIKLYDESRDMIQARQFDEAIEALNTAISKDPGFIEAYIRLGNLYKSLRQLDDAYQEFADAKSQIVDTRRYASIFLSMGSYEFSQGDYEKAQENLTIYLDHKSTNDKSRRTAEQLLRNCQFSLVNMKEDFEFNPRPLDSIVNSMDMQYFPVLTVDLNTLIFVSREQDEEIMVSQKVDGTWTVPEPISNNISTEFNEGTCSISADGRTLVFTSCMGRKGFGSCDLFISTKVGDDWSEPVNLGRNVNSPQWDSQPSLSADGRTLYFVSNRPGGFGQRDIWVSNKDKDGNWMKAFNLGADINTSQDDISPFIHPGGERLYFSANGRLGFGGFDIYFAELDSNQFWTDVTNFGYPVNTHNDEVSMFITADGRRGFYSHEEITDNKRESKLYEIDIPEQLQLHHRSSYVSGVVTSEESGLPVNANIKLVNLRTSDEINWVESDSVTGKYFIVLSEGSQYGMFVEKSGYLTRSINFNFENKPTEQPINIDIALQKIKPGAKIVLNNIFFDFDSDQLDARSRVELDRVVRLFDQNPKLHVQITGHTDNVGSEEYNLALSERRAHSVVRYLVSKRPDLDSRIMSRGMGSSEPIASNATLEGQQLNRRIEFKILK